jgi:dipeptidyl aminopeptidase/acylaminoacyl peptidase
MKHLNFTLSIGSLKRTAVLIAACLPMIVTMGQSEEVRHSSKVTEQRSMRPVSVADVIEMTQSGDPDYLGSASAAHNPAHFSPNGKHFVVVVKKGNIDKNTNDYSLLLFQTNKALRLASPEMLVSLSSSSNRPGIHEVRWVDDRTLTFLGENPGEPQQVYEVDCETKRLAKLTNHTTSVISYAIGTNSDRIVFLAERSVKPLFDESVTRTGMVISTQTLPDLLANESRWSAAAFQDLFVKTREGDQEVFVRTPGDLARSSLWLSPNSRYLIATTWIADVPEIWKNYEDRFVQSRVRANPLHGDSRFLPQRILIDMESCETKALLDAPLGDGRSEVMWSQDGASVIVSGTYLPLNVADAPERKRRQSSKTIAEIRIPSLQIVPISSADLHPLKWDPQTGNLLVESTSRSPASVSNGGLLAFRKKDGEWREVEPPRPGSGQVDETVTFEEDMNTPPKLFIKDVETGQKFLLVDLNPQFNSLEFGPVQNISFRATDGHTVNAGLYIPADYVQGKRYPLVIQTHGWNPERFWIDGSWPSAFAAQPLVGRGFVVLQLSEDVKMISTPEEAPKEASAYEGAIDYLNALGVVDRDRVGVIGFSRSGLGVEYALTHSKYHFAAATLAEASDGGYFTYLSVLPSFSWRWPDFEGINGGSPFGDGIASWLKKSPDFNLEVVTTPVREEAYHPFAILSAWEWFAGLSRLGKPVELIYVPNASHALVKPWDRLTSLQGNVDWFRFWLKCEEDPDPSKAEQYARWRELRNLQKKNNKSEWPAICK